MYELLIARPFKAVRQRLTLHLPNWQALDTDQWLRRLLICLLLIFLFATIIMPLSQLLIQSLYQNQMVQSETGLREVSEFVGISNFVEYFSNPSLSRSLFNSLKVAIATTCCSVGLALIYSLGLTRSCMPGRKILRLVALLPMFAPTLLFGLSLVYLFGRQGLITTGAFGLFPGVNIDLFGPVGIIIAEIIFTFPAVCLILQVALQNLDARLYEAADSFGTSRLRQFFTITLPGIKYGLFSALFVCFTLSFTDFGAPKVVGGNYPVLAVDIYKQVVGQQNFSMGATISLILLIPSLLAFWADQQIRKKQSATMNARSVIWQPQPDPKRDWLFFGLCSLIAASILIIIGMGVYASLVKMWPYDFSLSLRNYDFSATGSQGLGPYYNSLLMSALTAFFGTICAFGGAYLCEKSRGLPILRQLLKILGLIPLALPGLVIGIAYIFFFNKPTLDLFGWELSNPLHHLYGTMAILVISNIIHFYTVSSLTATTALRQLDHEFESASESLAVPFYVTFFKVTLPVCLPAILEIGLYFFVSSMTTLSAVVFLYSHETTVAAVSILNMDDAGDQAPAAAMCVLIIVTNLVVRGLVTLISNWRFKRSQTWRTR